MSNRFETGFEFLPGYRLHDRLGAGGFGEVWKCEAPGGIFKAVKIIHGDLRSQNDDMIRYAEQELKAMKRVKAVRHPYLLAIDRYDIIEGRLLVVMELADCNLWDRFRTCRINNLPGIPREDILLWMQEAAEVLDLMNFEHQLLHLDIKPQNIFLQYNHVKVGDFGQVKDLEGIMASVTGGITPVYAAPETFDGIVTRYCDQYSLACVYQELLTGIRPFDGSSMQQLMMQHLTSPPNLAPSPPADRAALFKALAKKPEDRFPNCLEFVKAIRGGFNPPTTVPVERHDATVAWGTPKATPDIALLDTQGGGSSSSVVSFATTGLTLTPLPEELAESQASRVAPPEVRGSGPLRPALVIGLGGSGLRILQQFRKQVNERFGGVNATPAVRTLFIDTDPDALAAAATDRTWDGIPAFAADEVYAARLQRATHYMKPRTNGRTLMEGWFDAKWLHLLPRNPLTQGLRALGRLALCDHYRTLVQKIDTDLETILAPEALHESMQATHLDLATNRPRVYLVGSVCGGTAGGMLLDLAYILRNRLRRLGYAEADVVGLLTLPPEDAEHEVMPAVRGNVYAALTELNHFSRPDTTFTANYDDRLGFLRDADAPFKAVHLVPERLAAPTLVTPLNVGTPTRGAWPPGRSGSIRVAEQQRSGVRRSGPQRHMERTATLAVLNEGGTAVLEPAADTAATLAHWLRLDLFGPFGAALGMVRDAGGGGEHVSVGTFNMVRHDWPRMEIVSRTARVVTSVMLNTWVSPDAGRARETVPAWTAALWAKLGLDLDGFIAKLRQAADQTVGTCTETLLAHSGDSALPKGWLNRTPDAAQVGHVLVKLEQFLGHPSGANQPPTAVDEAVRAAAADLATAAQAELSAAVPHLIDDPNFRLAGAEEAARQLIADLVRQAGVMNGRADELDAEAKLHHEALAAHAAKPGRVPAATLVEALQKYPRQRFQSLLARRAGRTYLALKEVLTTLRNDMANCRQKLVSLNTALQGELELPSPDPLPNQVMPPGCFTIDDAAKRYLDVLNDDDLHQVEAWVQSAIDRQYGGLYQACLNTTETSALLLNLLREGTRNYLHHRLGDVDLHAMFDQKYGSAVGIAEAFHGAFEAAAPDLVGPGPWSREGLSVFAGPGGDTGDALRATAMLHIPDADTIAQLVTPDETVLYREYPAVPLAALGHFGPAWQSAYETAAELTQCSPHTRTDVPQWKGVDS